MKVAYWHEPAHIGGQSMSALPRYIPQERGEALAELGRRRYPSAPAPACPSQRAEQAYRAPKRRP
jgi:hypothetical protein